MNESSHSKHAVYNTFITKRTAQLVGVACLYTGITSVAMAVMAHGQRSRRRNNGRWQQHQ